MTSSYCYRHKNKTLLSRIRINFQATTLFIFILLSSVSFGQTGKWTPTFDQFKIVPNPGYSNNSIRTLRDYLFFGSEMISKKESGIIYFRVNSKGEVDSVRTDGLFNPRIRNWLAGNIEGTSGKWTLPPGTKESDFCWFVVFVSNRKARLDTMLSIFNPVGNFSLAIKNLHQALVDKSDYFAEVQVNQNESQHLVHTEHGVIVNPLVYPDIISYK